MLSPAAVRRSVFLAFIFMIPHAGCAPVKPWERGKIASPAMQQKLGEQGVRGAYRAKVLESKTGGGLPGEAPGGGCGCTQ